jgi:hypothetical protein
MMCWRDSGFDYSLLKSVEFYICNVAEPWWAVAEISVLVLLLLLLNFSQVVWSLPANVY